MIRLTALNAILQAKLVGLRSQKTLFKTASYPTSIATHGGTLILGVQTKSKPCDINIIFSTKHSLTKIDIECAWSHALKEAGLLQNLGILVHIDKDISASNHRR
jgi:hypothetical protein